MRLMLLDTRALMKDQEVTGKNRHVVVTPLLNPNYILLYHCSDSEAITLWQRCPDTIDDDTMQMVENILADICIDAGLLQEELQFGVDRKLTVCVCNQAIHHTN